MFKLVKILNSGSNVAEPIRVRAGIGVGYQKGAAGYLVANNSAPAKPCSGDAVPDIIFGEYAPSRSGKVIKAYPVSRHMIFVTTFDEDPTDVTNGDHVTFTTNGGAITTDTEGGGCVEIYNMNGATKAGDPVYVRFDI